MKRWKDQSIHGHVAVPVGDAPAWPILTTPAEVGRPGVRFGPAGITADVRRLRIADHRALQFTGDFAIIAVLRYRNALVPTAMLTGAIYTKLCETCSDFRGLAVFANDNWGLFTDDTPSRSGFTMQIGFYSNTFARTPQDGFNDNAPHIVVARRLGGTLSIAADRHSAGVTDTGFVDVSTPGWDVIIGANPGFVDQVLDGELFELIAVPGQERVRRRHARRLPRDFIRDSRTVTPRKRGSFRLQVHVTAARCAAFVIAGSLVAGCGEFGYFCSGSL